MTYGYGYGGELRSPERGYRLEEITGRPGEIEAAGERYSRLGWRMDWTAEELEKLAASTKYKAEGLDAIRESAGELAAELRKLAIRYNGTGPVLVTYAEALRDAQQTGVDPHVEPIRAAHQRVQEAEAELRSAQSAQNDLDTTWIWEDEPTQADRNAAASDVRDAQGTLGTAEGSLSELWVSFESGYSAWDSAYEDAVTGVRDACDASGINDTWWEDLLDGLAAVATIVGTIAVIAALIVTGPLAGILLAIAAVASIIALAAHLTMMIAGSKRVSMTDIVFDLIGVLPFVGALGKGVLAGRGFFASLRGAAGLGGASRTTLQAGRNAVFADVRSISGAGGSFGGQANRLIRASGVADNFLAGVRGSWASSTWNAIRHGGTRLDGQALLMSQRMTSAWPGGRIGQASQAWLQGVDSAGSVLQVTNVWNLGYGGYQTAQEFGVPLPDIPDFVPNPFGGR